jgi:hypothetical protein
VVHPNVVDGLRLADFLSLLALPFRSGVLASFCPGSPAIALFSVRSLRIRTQNTPNLHHQKMYMIYFKPLIEFVPTIFVFSRDPPDFPRPGAFEANCIPPASPSPTRVRRQEGRILLKSAHWAAKSPWFSVRFEFVFGTSSFVFKDILASIVLFFVYFDSLFSRSAGAFRFSSGSTAPSALAYDNVSLK